MICGIYIAFCCALSLWAAVIGSSKEERGIKGDVSDQERWKVISRLGGTCGLCPSCSKYLLFISTAALLHAGMAHAIGVMLVHEKPSLHPLLPWAHTTLPSVVTSLYSSLHLLHSPEAP